MARPERNNVDYFPLLCKKGPSMKYIEQKYGNDGFGTWIKILWQLAIKDYHFINLSKQKDLMSLAAECMVSEKVLFDIVTDLVEFEDFDKELWENQRVIFCQKLIDSIQDAYKKRNNECITREEVVALIKGVSITVVQKQPVKPANEKGFVAPITHELFKPHKSIEQWFIDLPNGNDIIDIARITKIPLETVKSKIEPFKKAAELSYPNYIKFITHFKNWVAKGSEKELLTAPKGKRLD